MENLNQIVEAIMPYVVVIVTAIFGYLATVIKNKLSQKIDTETKKEVAEATVKYVQQVYETLDGKEKLQKALDTSIEWLNEKGIKITEVEATILIEAAIKGFKDSWTTVKTTDYKVLEENTGEKTEDEITVKEAKITE